MHELSVTEGILNAALKELPGNGSCRIISIRLVLGELCGVVPDCVREYFDLLSEDTPAQGAELKFTVLPALLRCRSCGNEFRMEHMRLRCPACLGGGVDIVQGKEFYLESLEIETETE
ncbi:MAG: hydrogenase maturation nickel metallochaperone HypA [Butyrivibrio sp.]|nr:hydrogenase maturation nickel metallochaperone HypA [Butyrivibrio sp.]